MVTLDLGHFDLETEVAIVRAKSKLEHEDALAVVRIVRDLRETGLCEFAPSVRGCMMIARAAETLDCSASADDPDFRNLCIDVLASESSRIGRKNPEVVQLIEELVDRHTGSKKRTTKAARNQSVEQHINA
jgi:hypothetical protein